MDKLPAGTDPTPPRPMASATPLPTAADLAAFAPKPVATSGHGASRSQMVTQHAHEPTPPAPLAASTPLPVQGITSADAAGQGESRGASEHQACNSPVHPKLGSQQSSNTMTLSLPAVAESPYIAPRRALGRAPQSLARQSMSPSKWQENVAFGAIAGSTELGFGADQYQDGRSANLIESGQESVVNWSQSTDQVELGDSFVTSDGRKDGTGAVKAVRTGAASPNENAVSNH